MKKAVRAPEPILSPQIGVRISRQERLLLNRLIATAERKSGLAPGTISPASYARSALLGYMAQALAELEASGEEAQPRGPNAWDRLRENVALMGDETKPKK